MEIKIKNCFHFCSARITFGWIGVFCDRLIKRWSYKDYLYLQLCKLCKKIKYSQLLSWKLFLATNVKCEVSSILIGRTFVKKM